MINHERGHSRFAFYRYNKNRGHGWNSTLNVFTPFPCLTKAPCTLRQRNLKTELSLSKRIKCFLSTLHRRNLKTELSLWRIKCFPSTLSRWNLKTQQSPVILDLCFGKTRAGKSRDYRDAIGFEKLRFQIFSVHVTWKTKNRHFQISSVWRAFSKSR